MSKAGKKINRKIGTHAENGDPIEGLDLSTEKASQMFQDLNGKKIEITRIRNITFG